MTKYDFTKPGQWNDYIVAVQKKKYPKGLDGTDLSYQLGILQVICASMFNRLTADQQATIIRIYGDMAND